LGIFRAQPTSSDDEHIARRAQEPWLGRTASSAGRRLWRMEQRRANHDYTHSPDNAQQHDCQALGRIWRER
jgi:hypothetical protein